MSQPTSPQKTTRVFGNYEVLSVLGKGGMAEVYRARVLSGPREGWTVALKRLLPALTRDPESVSLFAREAQLSKQLHHPNIVTVLDAGALEGIYFIVMELVDGRDLGQILRRCKVRGIPLPLDFAVYLGKVLLEALAYAHSATGPQGERLGIVHCDVSPSNLFISRVGEIKLGDFGVSRVLVDGKLQGGEVLGKPYYLSPESLLGEVNPEADLWAATVVLYELLTLERPFTGTTPDAVFNAIRARQYRPLRELRPDIPEALEAVVARAFAERPEDRFPTAEEFAQALTPHYDERVGTPLAIAAVVRGLFGASDEVPAAPSPSGTPPTPGTRAE
ncbi:serine/threonine protein kinase [Myxococcus xanthus DK 1622]|uniref:Serine/threonine protein kinase n=1 Tax=Myxococcus xanthus (strain DK1622) TaxID=246197 RepID=Q1D834_MYXXD|nr:MULTISPECIES: serine/threonine-protein kinase [Myxococcus]ABF91363.1 serine/threonine protein kinase [Myxococcus xanthus DK 1622]NOJ55209.1 serine/threonine protein kinase [Myxococcus xanthus]QPM82455.1 serine/threonine protein kinase [Myxococcus xanthus]QVW64760.1 serine/threonine protein kinase [Myxococcus xanthus DZ2]QZZ50698.1 Tyrosine-protein kinase MasK [Myxococcus xanthus]